MLFFSQTVIHSATLFKQSVSLSKHVNPPTSSLFPWTPAATGTHMHTAVSAALASIFKQIPLFFCIFKWEANQNTAWTGRDGWIFSLEREINQCDRTLLRFVVLFHIFLCSLSQKRDDVQWIHRIFCKLIVWQLIGKKVSFYFCITTNADVVLLQRCLSVQCRLLTSAVLMLMFEYEARYKSFEMAGRGGHYKPLVVKETACFWCYGLWE